MYVDVWNFIKKAIDESDPTPKIVKYAARYEYQLRGRLMPFRVAIVPEEIVPFTEMEMSPTDSLKTERRYGYHGTEVLPSERLDSPYLVELYDRYSDIIGIYVHDFNVYGADRYIISDWKERLLREVYEHGGYVNWENMNMTNQGMVDYSREISWLSSRQAMSTIR